jgi:hypothetical protein
MAVECTFISLIIPVSAVDIVYTGGFEKYKSDYEESWGLILWHDDFLLREGAMNPMDIEYMVESWEKLGLEGIVDVDGEKRWKDFCVIGNIYSGPTLPCDWIEVDVDTHSVHYKEQPKGAIVGMERDKLK